MGDVPHLVEPRILERPLVDHCPECARPWPR
jgi:hypothetical protein